ncbi:bcl-2-like protein 1 [Rhinophrynus dorsalis]
MEGGSRELVENFVGKKLSQGGVVRDGFSICQFKAVSNGTSSTEQTECPEGERSQSTVRQDVLLALQEAAEEFELRYQRAFSDLTSQLHITPDTAYQSFEQVVAELFRDGINWGRVVAFFSFGRALCVESANEMSDLLPRIIHWMATYLDEHLKPWIQENGGWEAFVSLYGNDAAARSRRSQEFFGRWLLTAVTLTGVALLVSYVARR